MEKHRITNQRRVILEELQKLATHTTAADLYKIVRRQLPRISLGTIYRNLELLIRSGTIRKIDNGSKKARFDGDMSNHYHVRCHQCGRVDDLPGSPRIELSRKIQGHNGWDIAEHRIEFVGVCPDCRVNNGM